ncbi:MAG: hypothetical protein AB8F95_05635 [Bacteroidia bacterium]
MIRPFIIIMVGLLLVPKLSAQTSGYNGMRTMVKTNLSTWAFNQEANVELDHVLNRRITLGLSYREIHRNYNQDFFFEKRDVSTGNFGERMRFSEHNPELADEIANGGRTNGNELNITFKVFYKGSSPAPIGLYSEFIFGTARADASGITVEGQFEVPEVSPGGSDYIPVRYTMSGIRHNIIGFGFGHQSVHKKRFILDVGYYLRRRFIRYPNFYLGRFPAGGFDDVIAPIYLTGADIDNQVSEGHLYVKLGILLF